MIRPIKILGLVLFLISSFPLLAQELPGGNLTIRPAHSSERGQHPRVLVQTVPGAITTATSLVIRYREPGKKGPNPGTAHALEHLLYRTQPGGRPGQLLLRNETYGGQSRALVTANEIIFSEEVPADQGLESLTLQLNRLTEAPRDEEGLNLEQQAIRNEIRGARTPEEKGRRDLLRRLGQPCRPEGTWEEVKGASPARFEELLDQIKIDEDVVLAVVGPHSDREVRQHLSKNLKPLAGKRTEPRPALKPVESPLEKLELESPSNVSQTSVFFNHTVKDPRLLTVANALLTEQVDEAKFHLARESHDLLRLDRSPAEASLQPVFEDLTPEQSQALFKSLQRTWLERYESAQQRAEMLALTSLREQEIDSPITAEEFPQLVRAAKEILKDSQRPLAELRLKPADGKTRAALFTFRSTANRGTNPDVRLEQLPNQLGVTIQHRETWPVVALSGFFRVSPSLEPHRMSQLQKTLNSRRDLMLEYEVKPNGVFFHTWAPSSELKTVLKSTAAELQSLSRADDLLARATSFRASLIDKFFLQTPTTAIKAKPLKGSKVFNPRDAHLVIVGKLEEKALDQGLRPDWSGWFGKSTPPSLKPRSPESLTTESTDKGKVVEVRASAQPVLLVGFWGPSRSSPNFLAFNLALQTLAGRPATSVLSRQLKSEFPEVASIKLLPLSASVSNGRQLWLIALRLSDSVPDIEPIVDRVKIMLKSLSERPLPKSELDRTRSYLKSSLVMSSASSGGRARVLAHAEYYRLSKNYANDFAGLYDNLTPPLVQAVCKPFLEKAEPSWLYLKPKSQ